MNRLTLDELRKMSMKDMLEACYARLAVYDGPLPNEAESEQQRNVRIGRTLDELPDLHSFFLHAKGWHNHWVSHYSIEKGYGVRSQEYKENKERYDAFDDLARACRLRYEATSRRLTQMTSEWDAANAPRSRG
jgi:hypothetical protein